ncbi:MAG: hypothetical protein OIF57_03445 [Marinobacterium sp.]|nr:hypothetical protein [Marinobacterium sp.]
MTAMDANTHLFGQVAPTLAMALDGPCATMAQRFLLEGLKTAEVDVDIRQPLQQQEWLHDTRVMQTVRKLEQEFQQEIKGLGLTEEALRVPDDKTVTVQLPGTSSPDQPRYKQRDRYGPQLLMSVVFLAAYFAILAAVIYIEANDSLNMKKGENSFMDQIQILIGVLTAGVGQILSYWFGGMMGSKSE